MNMQNENATWTYCMAMQQGHKAWAYTSLKTLAFPPAERIWLWNRVSSLMRQRKGKARIRAFFFCARRLRCFSRSFFSRSRTLFSLCVRERESTKKLRPPTSAGQSLARLLLALESLLHNIHYFRRFTDSFAIINNSGSSGGKTFLAKSKTTLI
jgi:hypothetical protein